MPKVNRCGQAEIFTEVDSRRVLSKIKNKKHRLLFQIATYTAERWGAILKLKVDAVYYNPAESIPRKEIIFVSSSRKKDTKGHSETRTVPIHSALALALESYKPPLTGWLFPGGSPANHLSFRCADKALRKALVAAKLDKKGYSTHSTRRTFITTTYRRGADIRALQSVTGHKSIQSLERYIEEDPQRKAQIVELF